MGSEENNVSRLRSQSAESSSSKASYPPPTSYATSRSLIRRETSAASTENSHSELHTSPTSTSIPLEDLDIGDGIKGKKVGFTTDSSTSNELESRHEIEDGGSEFTDFTEDTSVPRRNLGYIQTLSIMINSSAGYGIFITPGYVLALTRSKEICLILWAVGGIYSALA